MKKEDCEGKHILIVEDIYDTGNTMKKMLDTIGEYRAASVKSCVLLHKREPSNLQFNYFPDYLGFTIPCHFVIGYGMDYNERFRDMRHICLINENGIKKFAEPILVKQVSDEAEKAR